MYDRCYFSIHRTSNIRWRSDSWNSQWWKKSYSALHCSRTTQLGYCKYFFHSFIHITCDLFCFGQKTKLKFRFRELRIGWPIILLIQWRKFTRNRWNLSIEHCRLVLHLSYWEYQYFCMSWFTFNKKRSSPCRGSDV